MDNNQGAVIRNQLSVIGYPGPGPGTRPIELEHKMPNPSRPARIYSNSIKLDPLHWTDTKDTQQ